MQIVLTNYSKYKHIYYISQINNIHQKLGVDPENINQKIEIGDINWYSFEEGSQKIRNYNIEKRNVFYTLHNTIRFTIINFKEILNNFLQFLQEGIEIYLIIEILVKIEILVIKIIKIMI